MNRDRSNPEVCDSEILFCLNGFTDLIHTSKVSDGKRNLRKKIFNADTITSLHGWVLFMESRVPIVVV